MSICAMVIMGVLFFSETAAFVSTQYCHQHHVGREHANRKFASLNITLTDLPCDYMSVSMFGIRHESSKRDENVDKWHWINGATHL
jgi:hypothetical protein